MSDRGIVKRAFKAAYRAGHADGERQLPKRARDAWRAWAAGAQPDVVIRAFKAGYNAGHLDGERRIQARAKDAWQAWVGVPVLLP